MVCLVGVGFTVRGGRIMSACVGGNGVIVGCFVRVATTTLVTSTTTTGAGGADSTVCPLVCNAATPTATAKSKATKIVSTHNTDFILDS